MRKLKVALVAIMAVLMCVGLIACGGKKKPTPTEPTDYKVRRIEMSQTSFTLTDADGEDAWESKVLDKLGARVQYTDPGGNATLKQDGLTVDKSSVKLGSIGVYSATVTPKEHNADNMSATIEITVEHNIVDGVCTVDGATLSTEEIDIDLTYLAFHTGDSTLNANGSNAIRPFGSVVVDGNTERVKTHTVGRLEKGMTITVKGTAITNYQDKAEEKAYFFPILGFADTSIGEYTGGVGTSVIVRNEGWVLLDGIGAPRLLAALAGNGSGGANDTGNYGSHPSDTGNKPLPGYTDHGEGTPTLEQWHDWYTYSTGDTSNTTTYLQEQKIELSWTYREDGIIELTTVNTTDPANPYKLIARTKVPDSAKGYYDTILHGEYVEMHFDEISTLSTRTLESVQFDGLVDGANKNYLENEMLDLSTLDVKITTKQESTPASDTQFDVEANIGTAEEPVWVSLSETPLSQSMTAFRVTRTMGNITKVADIPASFITIAKNAVNEAYAYTVEIDGVAFGNNATFNKLPFSSTVEDGTAIAVLKVTGAADGTNAAANTLSDAQKAKLAGATTDKYIAFRIWAREGADTKFKAGAAATVTSGRNAVAGAYVNVTADYADIVLPIDEEIAAAGVLLAGLTDDGVSVKLDLTGLDCLTVTTQVTSDRLYLDKGGNVTIVYDLGTEGYAAMKANIANTQLYANTANIRFQDIGIRNADATGGTGKLGDIEISVALNEGAGTITVTYAIPKFTVTNINKYDLSLSVRSGNRMVRQAMETVYYEMAFSGDNGVGQAIGDNVYVEAEGTTLYAVIANRTANLRTEDVRLETLNLNVNGGTVESVNFLNLGYRLVKGSFMFFGVIPEGGAEATLTVFGSLDNDKDTDYGSVVVIKVDATKLGVSAAPFYFELNADTSGKPAFILKAADNKVEKVTVAESSLGVLELVTNASCLEKGYASYPYSENGTVVFFAGLTEIGGAHKFEGNTCVLCGATKTSKSFAQTVTINENEFVQVSGKYSAAIQEEIYNGITMKVVAGNDWYWIRTDSFISKNTTGAEGITASEIWHSFDDPEDPENYNLRTPNGKLSGVDGEEINDSLFNEAKRNADFNVYVGYADGTVTVIYEMYTAGETKAAYFSFEIRISDIHRTDVSVEFGLDAVTLSGNAQYVTGKIVNSMIDEIGETAFTLNDVSWNVGARYTVSAPANGAVTVTGEGKAFELDAAHRTALGADAKYTHYIAIPVKLTQNLAQDIFVRVRANGTIVNGAVATIDGNTVYAVIPTDGTVTDYVLDFGSLSANTKQCDIALDLSGVVTANTTAALTGTPDLISGGTVTIVYSDLTAADTDEMVINGVSAKKSQLVAGYDFGNGISVKSATASGTTFTVELTVAAPDLTEAITDYTVAYKKNGVIQAQNKFGYFRLPTAPVAGDAKVNDTVYAKAAGSKLTLIAAGVSAGSTELKLNANNGKAIGADNLTLIQLYDLSFNVSKNGFAFASTNRISENTEVYYSEINGVYVVMLVVDLTAMQIGENTAYKFEVLPATVADSTTIFSVSANREISDPDSFMLGERKELVKSSCHSIGVEAEAYDSKESFYFNVLATPSHTWGAADARGLQVCTVCGAIMRGGISSAQKVSASALAPADGTSLVETGLTVSFLSSGTPTGVSADWASQGLATSKGNLIITLPNLDPWNNSVAGLEGATDREKELAALIKSANAFPAGDNLMNGFTYDCFLGKEVYATITVSTTTGIRYFVNGVLAIEYPIDKVVGNGTAGDFAELFLSLASRVGITVAPANVTARNMLVQKTALSENEVMERYELYEAEKATLPDLPAPEYPDWNDDPTASATVKLGSADNKAAYEPNVWMAGISKGEKVVITGTMTSVADQGVANNWNAPVVTLFSGLSFKGVMRADNYILDGDAMKTAEGWNIAQSNEVENEDKEPSLAGDSAFWATARTIFHNANITFTFDWSDASTIAITMKFESATAGYENSYTQSYTITHAGAGELAKGYTIGLGIDGCYVVLNGCTRTNG